MPDAPSVPLEEFIAEHDRNWDPLAAAIRSDEAPAIEFID